MSGLEARFDAAFAACPLVAILRGVRPDEVEAIGEALVAAGFRLIEVPLNSPQPFDSIARLARRLDGRALVGAGTVTDVAEVAQLARIGAALVVSPHTDPEVIGATRAAGMISLPGILSPSEAFAALKAGAHGLKLFPMEMIGASGVKAMRAVLPRGVRLIAVGGVGVAEMPALRAAGCDGFGLGSALYKPGASVTEVAATAGRFVAALG